MKNLAGMVVVASLFLVSFKPLNLDEVATAIRSGNVDQLSSFFDNRVDLSLPDKTDTYSKSQAEMIIRDFFSRYGVRNFQIKQRGETGGLEFCIGTLQTQNGDFRTCLYLKQKGDRQFIQQLRFQVLQ